MVKKLFTVSTLALTLTAFSPAKAQKAKTSSNTNAPKPQPRFLDDIEIGTGRAAETTPLELQKSDKPQSADPQFIAKKEESNLEGAHNLQLKYAVLLNTEVEDLQNIKLLQLIDEWYGTRYQMGGNTKEGIDCSGFVQVLYQQLFNIPMPRTAREQYAATRIINKSELKEGDLVFFNTRGGISHVGFYLQNNKFVHASSSGVLISDLGEEYWSKRFIGVGHYERPSEALALTTRP